MTTDATRPEEALDDQLELELRDHYRAIEPATDARLSGRIAAALDAPRPTRRNSTLWRLAAVAAVVALVAAGLIVPRFLPAIGPEATSPISGPSAPPGTGFDATKALRASVDAAGQMRSGGLWAVESGDLLTSSDDGATWKAGHVPWPVEAIDVLDAAHAWVVSAGASSPQVMIGLSATMPPVDSIVVNRTTDGGATWTSVRLDQGDCDTVELSFVDSDRGFLMCRGAAGSSDPSSSTILDTMDGGATWKVAGAGLSLGTDLVATDGSTLWTSSPAGRSSSHIAPMVSRDGGATWAWVSLPEAKSLEDAPGIEVSTTPLWWDGQNGSLAADIVWYGQPKGPQVWFYRTSDGGLNWNLTKVDRHMASLGLEYMVGAVTGPVWAVISDDGFAGFKTSTNYGKTWTSFQGSGMPPSMPWRALTFYDASHGAGLAFVNEGHTNVLLISSDGGRTWQPADFGDARTRASADPASDQAIAEAMAADFETYAFKVPSSAWAMLSAQSQAGYGSESAFEMAEKALAEQSNYRFTPGSATRDPSLLNEASLGSSVWSNLNSSAILGRAYVVPITFAEGPVSRRLLVVAPLAGTGAWRVWVVGTGPGS